MNRITIPPIKSQGIKTKLVPWIKSILPSNVDGVWIEPFMGTGVVAFTLAPPRAILGDTNPYLINFYKAVQNNSITPHTAKSFLTEEGKLLSEKGEKHYYYIRDRFNEEHHPLDFLFLNRSCFNGLIRFNKKGGFNVPFCRKPGRFSKSYITKIVNQLSRVSFVLESRDYQFVCQDFQTTIQGAGTCDIIYCDPPYITRHTDYFNTWDKKSEEDLYRSLVSSQSRFILSTWHHNKYRENDDINTRWKEFSVFTREHFYHVGGREKNRNPVVEALVTNFPALK